MKNRKTTVRILCIILLIVSCLSLVGCSSSKPECYYAYFDGSAFAFVYAPKKNTLYEISLPLEQILLWGNNAGLDSIPVAMKNFVGLKDSGFTIGTAQTLVTIRDLFDSLRSDPSLEQTPDVRLQTFVEQASVLSKKPMLDKMNTLCGADMAKLLALAADKKPKTCYFDAKNFINSEDLNFSQRYFTQWLEQVLGGNT